ncbi:hypothetical protein [Sutterella sp.]|uniref:hypothetical protein n=1 Tax=Sutterella sp. TaxID=1981025 RepID=UPI0026DF1553|nr:hypothetical protein [Sutterella sp.]MDO5531043.1 hypothetical protein [Sutterella sp.]
MAEIFICLALIFLAVASVFQSLAIRDMRQQLWEVQLMLEEHRPLDGDALKEVR